MAPILNQQDIVSTALQIVRTEGPTRLTARTLAAQLFVAPATLYNYVESMDAVSGMVEQVLLKEMFASIPEGTPEDRIRSMMTWFAQHPLEAKLVLNPTRQHPDLGTDTILELFKSSSGSLTPSSVEDVRGIMALLTVVASETSIDAIPTWYEALKPHVTQAGASSGADMGNPSNLPDPLDAAKAIVEQDSEATDALRSVRLASLDIIGQRKEWSFQGMANATGLSVGKLHRLGSRGEHLARYAADWLRGAVNVIASTNDAPPVQVRTISQMFAASGLSVTAMGDLWAMPDRGIWEPLVEHCSSILPDDCPFPADVVVAVTAGLLVSRLSRAASDEDRQQVGQVAGQLAEAMLAGAAS